MAGTTFCCPNCKTTLDVERLLLLRAATSIDFIIGNARNEIETAIAQNGTVNLERFNDAIRGAIDTAEHVRAAIENYNRTR